MTKPVSVEELLAQLDDPPSMVLEKMARRVERYVATGELPLQKAPRRCVSCPFRGADKQTIQECAMVPAQDWPCHTDESEHCAGHHAAQVRHGKPTAADLRALANQEKK
jgi:hypothetical protein